MKPKGHVQLGIRGATTTAQAVLTSILIAEDVDVLHKVPMLVAQMVAAGSLYAQWILNDRRMFIVRAVPSFGRCLVMLHAAMCGRIYPWESSSSECFFEAWETELWFFRVLHVFAAVRFFLNGLSLVLHFSFPTRGVSETEGNEQLWYRARVRISGIPLNLCRGMGKIVILVRGPYERSTLEITVDFLRCVIIALAAASLQRQWLTSGTGKPVSSTTLRDREVHEKDSDKISPTPDADVSHVSQMPAVSKEVL